jgi:alpha-1,4-digalacturonate transport system permease protein
MSKHLEFHGDTLGLANAFGDVVPIRIFRRVVLPLSWPVIAVLSIFTFMWRWNDFAWPLVVLQEESAYTVPLGLNLMQGQYFTDWTGLMSMSLLSIIPMMLVFVFFQRYFIQGIASTGLK